MPRSPERPPVRRIQRRSPIPGVGVLHITVEDGLSRAVPHLFSSVLYVEGESAWSAGGQTHTVRPGTIGLKVPGEVYTEQARRGRTGLQVVTFEAAQIEQARVALDRGGAASPRAAHFDRGDARARPLLELHLALRDPETTPDELEPLLAGALATFVRATFSAAPRTGPRPSHRHAVARARAFIDERFPEAVTLDELATHARLDKFRLCRAFREQVGLPPHAYLTHRRISLAQELLARGVSQAEVALRVGLYDQSQLHRHFKRILGVTPGTYARGRD